MAGEKNQRAVESDVNLSKGTELNKKFSPEEKHLKKCSTCLFIREMQIKMALRFHFTQVRSKLTRQLVLARMWRKRNTPPLLVGLQAGTTTLEISLAVPQKIGHNTTGRPHYITPRHIPRVFSSM